MPQRSLFKSSCFALAAAAWVLPACTLEKKDDGAEFREAVPHQEAVVVRGPESDDAGTASTSSVVNSRGTLAEEPWERGPYAKWYGFTRSVRGGVNVVTAAVLGSVWAVVHSEPTEISEDRAVWGPFSDALEPAEYRFVVERTGDEQYRYVLEGRDKDSDDDSDYRAVLDGVGYGLADARHGEGQFTIDLDVARELDPYRHRDDSGTIKIVHHLPNDIRRGDALPRTLIAEVKPNDEVTAEWFNITSTENVDRTGSLHVDAFADVDDSKLTLPEDVVIDSRWKSSGAGRADITIAGGDVPETLGVVSAIECWDTEFLRSYYSDSVDFAPEEGDASACVYDAPPSD